MPSRGKHAKVYAARREDGEAICALPFINFELAPLSPFSTLSLCPSLTFVVFLFNGSLGSTSSKYIFWWDSA